MTNSDEDVKLAFETIHQNVKREREAQEREDRQRIFSPISTPALAWLVACEWLPLPVAEALSLVSGEPSTLSRLAEAGYFEATSPTDYAITFSGIDTLIAELTQRPDADPLRDLRANLSPLRSVTLTQPQQRLFDLVDSASTNEQLVQVFEQKIDELCNPDRADAEAVLDWIGTGRPLAVLFSNYLDHKMDAAVEWAIRQQDLLRRRIYDKRHLKKFQKRKEQFDAVDELLRGSNEQWALHFLGSGGVGKTMLLRHITANAKGSIARIDFDYLNADYPRRDPGLFLSTFAQELRFHDQNGLATESFVKARGYFDSVLAAASNHREAGYRASADPNFVEGVTNFVMALSALPEPVVLILDTCEELMKVRLDGTVPESVEETFRILTALHDGPETLTGATPVEGSGLPTIRVIFAGRRLLARSGVGWSSSQTLTLPPRPFLRLHELRGFTSEEAKKFILDLGSPEELIQPIMERSPETSRVAEVTFDPPRDDVKVKRYNPYKLSFFGGWAAAEPDVAKKDIPNDSGKSYVEIRVLRSIKYPPLAEHFPLIAAARHVDRAFLTHCTDLKEDEIDVCMSELFGSEWADGRRVVNDEGVSDYIISIKPEIQRELTNYYKGSTGKVTNLVERAATYMQERTETAPMSSLDWTAFDAAARLLGPRIERAAQWWARIEERAIRERDFKWLFDITSALVAEDGAAAAEHGIGNPLRPWVQASYASAVLHERRGDATAIWVEIWSALAGRTGPQWDRLRVRTAAGLFSTKTFARGKHLSEEMVSRWGLLDAALGDESLDVELAASIVAACENVLEHLEEMEQQDRKSHEVLARVRSTLGALCTHLAESGAEAPRMLRSFAHVLNGRAAIIAHDHSRRIALESFPAALELAQDLVARPQFLDWVTPADFLSRVQLEAARHLYPNIMGPDETLALMRRLPVFAADADSERLLSRILAMQSARAVPDPSGIVERNRETPMFRSECAAHRATPPLCVTVAHAVAGLGRVDEAVAILENGMLAPNPERVALHAAQREMLRLSRRMRLYEEGIGLPTSDELREEIWALDAVVGVQPDLTPKKGRPLSYAALHAGWSATSLQAGGIRPIISANILTAQQPPKVRNLQSAQFELDFAEAMRVKRESIAKFDWQWMHALEGDREELLEIELRITALREEKAAPKRVADLARQIGIRRAAEIALDLGQSVYLRFPEHSLALFRQACEWFSAVGDKIGVFLSAVNGAVARRTAYAARGEIVDALAAYAEVRPIIGGPEIASLLRDVMLDDDAWERITPSGWKPWIIRLLLVYQLSESDPGRVIDQEVRDRLRRSRGRTVQTSWRTSIDIDQLTWTQSREVKARVKGKKKTGETTVVEAVTGGVFISILVSVIGYFLGRWAVSDHFLATPPYLHKIAVVGIGVGILLIPLVLIVVIAALRDGSKDSVTGAGCGLVLLGVIFVVVRYLAKPWLHNTTFITQLAMYLLLMVAVVAVVLATTAWWSGVVAARSQILLSISSQIRDEYRRASQAYAATAKFTVIPPRFRLFPWPHFAEQGTASVEKTQELSTAGFAPYEQINAEKKGEVWDAIKAVVSSLGRRSAEMVIETSVQDAGTAWEAMLAEIDDKWPRRKRLLPRRITTESARPRVAHGWPRPLHVVVWSARSDFLRLGTIIWDAAGADVVAIDGDLNTLVRVGRIEHAHVLHVIATFDEGATGITVRGGGFAGPSFSSIDVMARTESAASLCRRVPAAQIIIVQPEPLRVSERGETDRQEASLSRRFAAELFALGVPAVIVLPRMEASKAAEIAAPFAARITTAPILDRGVLQGAVKVCQRTIVSAHNSDRTDAFEAVSDVVLYLQRDWRIEIS